jgi:hypothetical protein
MSKFTDDFFGFPIKIYDGFSLKKALEEEDKEGVDGPVPIDWIVGQVKLPAKDLHKLMWHDGFSRDRIVSDVAENGFDVTIVVSDIHGEFMCTWPRKKFEDKLNEFMEKWEGNVTRERIFPIRYIVDPHTAPAPGDGFITTSSDSPKKDPE